MIRFLPYAASGLLVAALWWLWSDRADLMDQSANLSRELSVQASIADQAALARAVADANAKRLTAKAAEYDDLREQLLRGEEDADLPDWFIAYLVRLLGVGTENDL